MSQSKRVTAIPSFDLVRFNFTHPLYQIHFSTILGVWVAGETEIKA